MSEPWLLPPDWSRPVVETLEWRTDVLTASRTGISQHRALRSLPRRTLTWRSLAYAAGRQWAALALAARQAETWLIPVWPDGQWLSTPLPAGATSIPCETSGRDFSAGGKALLYRSLTEHAVIAVAAIAANGLGTAAIAQ
ncbi:MAG: hypothetical protein LBL48_04860, partial [Azoarcus sp.]|nr:hypothetical protein [Azoarcus sp.]